jgi:RNA polymerase sigma-70 factor, ECF subfamily
MASFIVRNLPRPSDQDPLLRKSDSELIDLWKGGDDRSQLAARIFWERHSERLRRIAQNRLHHFHLAQEVVQEVWIKLTVYLSNDQAKPILNYARWLNQLAHRKSLDLLRMQKRQKSQASEAYDMNQLPDPSEMDEDLFAREIEEEILDFIEKLPDAKKTLMILAYQEGLTNCEIAERVGENYQAVKRRHQRIKQDLKTYLAEQGFVVEIAEQED